MEGTRHIHIIHNNNNQIVREDQRRYLYLHSINTNMSLDTTPNKILITCCKVILEKDNRQLHDLVRNKILMLEMDNHRSHHHQYPVISLCHNADIHNNHNNNNNNNMYLDMIRNTILMLSCKAILPANHQHWLQSRHRQSIMKSPWVWRIMPRISMLMLITTRHQHHKLPNLRDRSKRKFHLAQACSARINSALT